MRLRAAHANPAAIREAARAGARHRSGGGAGVGGRSAWCSRLVVAAGAGLLGLHCAVSHAMFFHCDRDSEPRVLYVSDLPLSMAQRQGDKPYEAIVEADVERMTAEVPKCRASRDAVLTVDLHSGGGDLQAGIRMGRYLMASAGGVRTRVSRDRYCVSACTFIFLGGTYREVQDGGSFEPHGFSRWRIWDSVWKKPSGAFAALVIGFPSASERDVLEPGLCASLGHVARGLTDLGRKCLAVDFGEGAPISPKSMSEADKNALGDMAQILSAAFMELERVTALKHLTGDRLERADPVYYVAWILKGFRSVARRHLEEGGDLADLEAMARSPLGKSVSRLVTFAQNSALEGSRDIQKFLEARNLSGNNLVDEKVLVRLMFSTSIIYTRPFTSKEMCRAGVVTIAIDC